MKKHLCIFHTAHEQHLPFDKEQIICRSGVVCWDEKAALSVLQIQECERQRSLHVKWVEGGQNRLRGLLGSAGAQLVVVLHVCPLLWGQSLHPCFLTLLPKIPCKAAELLQTYSSIKVWLHYFLGNSWYLFRNSVPWREKMEMRRCAFSTSFSFGLVG